MGYNMKRGSKPQFKNLGSSCAQCEGGKCTCGNPVSKFSIGGVLKGVGGAVSKSGDDSPAEMNIMGIAKKAMGAMGGSPTEYSSPNKHGDSPMGDEPDLAKHKAWHDEHGFEGEKPGPEERDFSEHNVAARDEEGTIEEQNAWEEENRKKGKFNPKAKSYKFK